MLRCLARGAKCGHTVWWGKLDPPQHYRNSFPRAVKRNENENIWEMSLETILAKQ
jgi:hypothetical protein